MAPRRPSAASLVLIGVALVATFVIACSSDASSKDGADGGSSSKDASGDVNRALPTCLDVGGYQCQPKGCLGGYAEIPGYDCGSSGGSCCAKSSASADASTDASQDALDAATGGG